MTKPTRKPFGSVFSVPRQEPGAIANCAYCDWSRFFPNRKRKRGSSRSRAKRALAGHVRKSHADKLPKSWDATFEPFGGDLDRSRRALDRHREDLRDYKTMIVSDESIIPRPNAEIDDALGTPRAWREKHNDERGDS